MSLEAFYQRLDEVLDQRESPADDPLLQSMIQQDPTIQEHWQAWQKIDRELSSASNSSAHASLTDSIFAAWKAEQGTDSEVTPASIPPAPLSGTNEPALAWRFTIQSLTTSSLTWTVAAVLLVGCGLAFWLTSESNTTDMAERIGEETPSQRTEEDPNLPALPSTEFAESTFPLEANEDDLEPVLLDDLFWQAQDRYWNLAEETKQNFAELALLLPSEEEELPLASQEPEEEEGGWFDGFGSKLRTLTGPVEESLQWWEEGEQPLPETSGRAS
ncbi:Hypothetical protein PBC10988_11850 [Planctomycetales bacterium 10988]|nr:Hypothetical protein PBC10988_11850 [Planctomycetales bacterium 10988]